MPVVSSPEAEVSSPEADVSSSGTGVSSPEAESLRIKLKIPRQFVNNDDGPPPLKKKKTTEKWEVVGGLKLSDEQPDMAGDQKLPDEKHIVVIPENCVQGSPYKERCPHSRLGELRDGTVPVGTGFLLADCSQRGYLGR